MDFNLTEERQMLQDSLRRFLGDHYDAATRHTIAQGDLGYSPEIWMKLAELGMIGALFAPEQGGFGGTAFDIAVLFEELGRAGALEPFMQTGVLAGGLIAQLGTSQQQQLLSEVMAGTLQLAFAHGEPQSRYDLNVVAATADLCGDGTSYVLNGRKSVVMNGGAANKLIVAARTQGALTDRDGISLFLLDADQQGLSRHAYGTLTGSRGCDITLCDCTVPVHALLGPRSAVFGVLEKHIARATIALCAEALGAMERAKALTVSYLQTRQQFGRPIGRFQVLQHRMADLVIEIEQVRSALINACWHFESSAVMRDRHVSAAKNLVGRVGRMVAEEAIQMHGGIGMTQDYELAYFAKRLVMIDHQFGDTDYHMARFIALSRD